MLRTKTSNPILITCPLRTRFDLYKALGCILNPKGWPAPNSINEMADLLREREIDRLVCSNWELTRDDDIAIVDVFQDLGISLQR